MKRAGPIALAAAAAVLAPLLVACSKVSSSPGNASSNPWTVPGVVRMSVNTDVNTFDPVISKLYVENYIEEAIFSGLVKYDAHGDLIPDLALEVPSLSNGGISRDGKTITYHLRTDARWEDGVPVTSADVAFTYARIMDPSVNSPVQSTYARIARVDTPDPHTVVLRLHEPFAPFLSQVFCNGAFGEIVPEHVLAGSRDFDRDPFNVHPIGSGPYRLARWDRGSSIVLQANPAYFGGAPHVREIDIQILPNENTQLVAVQSHQVDVEHPSATQIGVLRTIAGTRVLLANTYVLDYLTFNTEAPPFDDMRLRAALAAAIDRRRIAVTAFSGAAIVADTFIPPYNWAFDPANGAPSYDPPRAALLLDEDGWKTGPDGIRVKNGQRLSIDVVHSDSVAGGVIGQEVQAQWRSVGAAVQLRAAPRNMIYGSILVSGKYQVVVDSGGFDVDPDRSQQQESAFAQPHGFNDARYRDPQVDAWTEGALRTYDRAERKRYYALIQERLNHTLPYVPICWERFVFSVNADLSGFQPETVNSDFWNVQDWKM